MRPMLFVPLCIFATGCATARLQRFEPDVRPARAPETIVVFEKAPARPYTVIARVDSQTGAVFQGFNDLRAKIVDQAAQLGGDAVILGAESTKTDFLILATGLIPMEEDAVRRGHRLSLSDVHGLRSPPGRRR